MKPRLLNVKSDIQTTALRTILPTSAGSVSGLPAKTGAILRKKKLTLQTCCNTFDPRHSVIHGNKTFGGNFPLTTGSVFFRAFRLHGPTNKPSAEKKLREPLQNSNLSVLSANGTSERLLQNFRLVSCKFERFSGKMLESYFC